MEELKEELGKLLNDDTITTGKIKKLGRKTIQELCEKYKIIYKNMDEASKLIFNSIPNWLKNRKEIFSSTIKELEADVQEYISRGFFKNKKIKQLLEKTSFMNFQTDNVVYIIFNKYSNNIYIGETGRKFEIRIMEHLKNIGKKDMKLNIMMEKSGNYLFYILKKCNNSIDRKRLERMLIKILQPDLNSYFKKNKLIKQLKKSKDILNLSEFSDGKETCLFP